jgi:hypothetical protein
MSANVDFGGGKNRTMEYVLIGSLGLIIVCCLGYAGYHFLGHGGPKGHAGGEVHFKCTKEGCGYEFTMTEAEIRQAEKDGKAVFNPMQGNVKVTCKKCGELGARVMTQCPMCLGWYLGPDPSIRAPRRGWQGAEGQPDAGAQAPLTECPLCHKNFVEWYNQQNDKEHGH